MVLVRTSIHRGWGITWGLVDTTSAALIRRSPPVLGVPLRAYFEGYFARRRADRARDRRAPDETVRTLSAISCFRRYVDVVFVEYGEEQWRARAEKSSTRPRAPNSASSQAQRCGATA